MKHRPPGLLRPRMNPDLIMMVCTAGHVDHGKTSLVKLLTGCETDRLKEEQERQLTIELGFAPCLIGEDVFIGIVDVPGHEKFVRNMVAGVSGIDLALLCIAADDGVMPQTIEHLQIMEILGVRRGMVALTKIDLASPERVDAVKAEIRDFLRGTFMEAAPIYPLSSETTEGFFDFYDALVDQVRGLSKRRSLGVFRMPILNTFTREGFGNVVTGIPVEGTIAVGDQVELVPGGQRGKVRGLQRFLRDAPSGGYGQCLALNIPEFAKNPAVRGQVLCAPGYLNSWRIAHLRLDVVAGVDRPLRNAEEISFHVGTSEQRGKLYLLEGKTLAGGEEGLASVLLDEAVAAAEHDKFILRRFSPAVTVAGGEIIAFTPGSARPRKKQIVPGLRAFVDFFRGIDLDSPAGLDRKVAYFMRWQRPAGASGEEVARGVLLPAAEATASLERLERGGAVRRLGSDLLIHIESYAGCLEQVVARLEEAASSGGALSLTVADLRQGFEWPPALWSAIEADLEERGLARREGGRLVLESAADELEPGERELMKAILALYEESGFRSPRPDELAQKLNAAPAAIERLLEYLYARAELYRIGKNVVLSRSWLRRAQDLVIAAIEEHGVLNSADFKYHIESSRKYALAILDFLDLRRVTVRIGSDRKLASNYAKNTI